MPTLREILAAKKQRQEPAIEITVCKDNDSLQALIFLFASIGSYKFYDYIDLLEFFGFTYDITQGKAANEQPSLALLFAYITLYSLKLPPIQAGEKATHNLKAIGRFLTDKQQEILLTFIERRLS